MDDFAKMSLNSSMSHVGQVVYCVRVAPGGKLMATPLVKMRRLRIWDR